MTRTLVPLAERIGRMSAVDENGCWTWQGRPLNSGYGKMTVRESAGAKPSTKLAHRVSYETFVGPIPEGLVLDHLCRNRLCVNPRHLEPVTLRVNVMRSPISAAAINAAKTHCPQGHPYDAANTIFYTPANSEARYRLCRTCQLAHGRRAVA